MPRQWSGDRDAGWVGGELLDKEYLREKGAPRPEALKIALKLARSRTGKIEMKKQGTIKGRQGAFIWPRFEKKFLATGR